MNEQNPELTLKLIKGIVNADEITRKAVCYELGTMDPIAFTNGNFDKERPDDSKQRIIQSEEIAKHYTSYAGCDTAVYMDYKKLGCVQGISYKIDEVGQIGFKYVGTFSGLTQSSTFKIGGVPISMNLLFRKVADEGEKNNT